MAFLADGPISGLFEGAAAEATKPGADLTAKAGYVFNAVRVAVLLESAGRFVAATGAVSGSASSPWKTTSSCRPRTSCAVARATWVIGNAGFV